MSSYVLPVTPHFRFALPTATIRKKEKKKRERCELHSMEFYPRAFFLVCAYVRAGHIEVSHLIGKERRDIPVRTKHLLSLLA